VELAASVENACNIVGFEKEAKSFKPHLTIARVKEGAGLVKLPDQQVAFTSETLVTGFSLVESQLTREGPIYRSLEDFKLISLSV
jgi:2'-5' RNA ligase